MSEVVNVSKKEMCAICKRKKSGKIRQYAYYAEGETLNIINDSIGVLQKIEEWLGVEITDDNQKQQNLESKQVQGVKRHRYGDLNSISEKSTCEASTYNYSFLKFEETLCLLKERISFRVKIKNRISELIQKLNSVKIKFQDEQVKDLYRWCRSKWTL